MILLKQPEVAAPCLAVFAGELLTGCFPEYRGVLVVEIGVLGVPHVAVIAEVLLPAAIGELIPEQGVCGQPVKQTLPIPVADRVGSVRVRSLWPVAHVLGYSI